MGLNYIIKDALYSLGIVLLFTVTDWRSAKSVASALLKFIGTWLFLVLVQSVYYAFFGQSYMTFFVYGIVVVLYAAALCRFRISSRIILAACYYMFFVYAIHSIDILYILWTGKEAFDPFGSWSYFFEGIRCLLIFISFVFVFTYLKVCGTEEYEYVNHVGVAIFVAFLVIMLILPDYAEKGTALQNVIANTLLFLLQLLTYYMFYAMTKEHNRRLETQMINAHYVAERDQMHAMQKNHEDILMLRHEIRNQYSSMRDMLSEKRYDDLEKFFAGFEDRVLETIQYVDCGNFTVNSILNTELGKAKYYGFAIEYKIAVPPRMPVKETDLCSVLTNLIDNAIEACRKAELPPESVVIGVELKVQNKSLFIKVTNPLGESNRESALALKTTKDNAFLHGYGVKIVRRIADKYYGSVHYDVKDGVFIADVLLFLLCEDKEEAENE